MNAFQKACEAALYRVYSRHGINPLRDVLPAKEDAALRSEPGDVYIRHRFQSAKSDFEIYVYADEAGYFRNSSWHIFETQDNPDPDALIREFVAALESDIVAGSTVTG